MARHQIKNLTENIMKHCYVILLSIALFWSMDHCRWHCCAAMLEYWSCLCQPAPCCSWMTQQGVPNFTQRTTHTQGAEVLTWPFNLWNHVEYLYAPICGSVSGVLVQPLEWPEIIPRQWLWGFKSCWSCGLWESAPGPFIARKKALQSCGCGFPVHRGLFRWPRNPWLATQIGSPFHIMVALWAEKKMTFNSGKL